MLTLAAQEKILSFFRQIIHLSGLVYINPTTGPYFFKLLYAYRIFHALFCMISLQR